MSPSRSTGAFSGDPGLAEVIKAWPGLSPAIRTGILAMVKAASET